MMMMTRKKFTFSNALLPSTGVSSSADTYETMAPNAKDDNNFDIMLIIFYQKNKKAFFFFPWGIQTCHPKLVSLSLVGIVWNLNLLFFELL